MSAPSEVTVDFADGEQLLTSYWGYLTGGGLIIDDPGVEVGEAIALQVTIGSSETHVRLEGHVVKREPDTNKSIIAFRSGEAHDMLLSEAGIRAGSTGFYAAETSLDAAAQRIRMGRLLRVPAKHGSHGNCGHECVPF